MTDQTTDRAEGWAAIHPAEDFRSQPLNSFWRDLGAQHTALLAQYGRENFKRTVNQQYFNWSVFGILRFQFAAVVRAWMRRPDLSVLASRLDAAPTKGPDLFHPRGLSAVIYRLHVAMLASVVRRDDPEGLLRRLEEPTVGDPVRVRFDGVALSQDLCHAVHEYTGSSNICCGRHGRRSSRSGRVTGGSPTSSCLPAAYPIRHRRRPSCPGSRRLVPVDLLSGNADIRVPAGRVRCGASRRVGTGASRVSRAASGRDASIGHGRRCRQHQLAARDVTRGGGRLFLHD